MNMDFAHIWGQMSFIVKGIMAILVFMSVYSLGVSLERWWVFRNAKKQSVKFALEIGHLLKQEKLKEAIDLAKKYKVSHVARVVSPGLLEFAYEAHGGSVAGHDVVAAAERAIARAAMMTAADMRKGLGGLATIATTSVFVGLLATVVGIIRAFQGMATSGTGGLGAVSAGIAEALIGTALGLFVAIPAVWLYNYFLNKIERFNIEMTNSASELVDYFIKRMGSRAA